jgi:hypothetical protein
MEESIGRQLRVIRKVIAVTQAADIPLWLFGGWGLDARIGRITRLHDDIEFWVERIHAERSKAVLVEAGAMALTTQPPEEACEFTWDDLPFSTAYFDRQPDGSISQPLGRFSDWVFPPGSFGDERGMLDDMPVLAMSVSGMLAMKEQFPHLRNGGPWRQKDINDIEILRGLENRRLGQVGPNDSSRQLDLPVVDGVEPISCPTQCSGELASLMSGHVVVDLVSNATIHLHPRIEPDQRLFQQTRSPTEPRRHQCPPRRRGCLALPTIGLSECWIAAVACGRDA